MKAAEVKFLRRILADRYDRRDRSLVAVRMAETEGVGTATRSAVRYTEEDFARAANILRTRGYGLEQPAPGFSRSEAPDGGSEKTGAELVSKDLVAVVPIGLPQALPAGARFMAMRWQEALLLPYELLLVCENLEPLLKIGEYRWLDRLMNRRPVLALFRGEPGLLFRTGAAAEMIRVDNRPTLAFFDYDPKGLSMAAALPRRKALCLPEWADLEPVIMSARRDHLFTNSAHLCRTHLDRVDDPEIALAWTRLKLLATGLDQEGFPRE